MNNLINGISVQGTVNTTTDLEKVMNLYTSSFTTSFNEGFIKMLEFQLSKSSEQFPPISKVKKKEKQKTMRSSSSKVFNEGFEKLKNLTLREELQSCTSVKFDKTKHVTVSELGFKTIYDLDKRSNKMWKDYFSKSKVYLKKDVSTSKISQRILFDKSIKEFLIKSNSVTKVVTESKLDWLNEIKNYRKPKRVYVKGGRFGKVKGFNFYFQPNEKLKPCERRKLLLKSEDYIGQLLVEDLKMGIPMEVSLLTKTHLDPSLTDIELLDIWNDMYDSFGCRIPDFRERHERDFGLYSKNIIKNHSESDFAVKPKVLSWLNRKKINLSDLG